MSCERGPTASIILPSKYENPNILTKVLTSLDCQLKLSDQLIIVGNQENVHSLPKLPDSIKRRVCIIPDPNGGIAMARNIGFQQVYGDITVFLDADCIPSPDFLQMIKKTLKPNTLLQAPPWTQVINTSFSQDHMLWRKIITRNLYDKNPSLIVNGRGLAIFTDSLHQRLGSYPFDDTLKKHGGEDRQIGLNLSMNDIVIKMIDEKYGVTHFGEPISFIKLLKQKYIHGVGDGLTNVLMPDVFDKKNFNRAVKEPSAKGVDPYFALLLWTFYLLGAYTGIQQTKKLESISSCSYTRNY